MKHMPTGGRPSRGYCPATEVAGYTGKVRRRGLVQPAKAGFGFGSRRLKLPGSAERCN